MTAHSSLTHLMHNTITSHTPTTMQSPSHHTPHANKRTIDDAHASDNALDSPKRADTPECIPKRRRLAAQSDTKHKTQCSTDNHSDDLFETLEDKDLSPYCFLTNEELAIMDNIWRIDTLHDELEKEWQDIRNLVKNDASSLDEQWKELFKNQAQQSLIYNYDSPL